MFNENFTFDGPRSPSTESSNAPSTRDTSRSVSPCSPTGPFPPPRFSVTDLAAQFDQQRLRHDSQICYQSCESYANTDDDAGWALPSAGEGEELDMPVPSRARTAPARSYSPGRRMQRQANTRLLCTASHQDDIASLLSRMIDTNQCNITSRQSRPSPPASRSEDDEGYDSTECSSRRTSVVNLKYRRASDMHRTGASICKDARFRKDKAHVRQRSGGKA